MDKLLSLLAYLRCNEWEGFSVTQFVEGIPGDGVQDLEQNIRK
jgi:hypothetical protein